MDQVISVVLKKEMGYKKTVQKLAVSQTTLKRYVKMKRENSEYVIDKTNGKFKCVFNDQLELVGYFKSMKKILFGLMLDFCKLDFQIAERNDCANSFNQADGMAGQSWMNCAPRFELKKT